MENSKREFLKFAASLSALAVLPTSFSIDSRPKSWFEISIAQWSFQRQFYSGEMKTAEFPIFAAEKLGIYGIDYLSDFMLDIYKNPQALKQIKRVSDELGVKNEMIMCHKEGRIGNVDPLKRQSVIDAHFRWVEAAHHLGCQSIRVNARSGGTRQQQLDLVSDSLSKISQFAKPLGINIIVENLWGSDFSYKADFIKEVMDTVNMENCGTLPDLNNFRYDDPYKSVEVIMPYAKAVSAKSLDFDPKGKEKYIDYARMMKIVYDSGFRGYVGIEWEGCKKTPLEGVLLTKALLEKTRDEIALSK
ncbi:sugar phosphate isomerase/epimerase family protein [Paraglaciecola arctica]|uniref:sugar phosphate isomerase/epimerase family protein n=1 Tax=Paraglaciecola arctica TaxID=1128911 RepID=UPI001C06E677|nr:sugar phosphate isomerase/epimerase family protein [Paraglaciecola arctica]MBU3004248.1 sugar phosphate isomerase/epimerase [Paraglaciecola arctica]